MRLRTAALAAVLLAQAAPARAVDEIQVYNGEINRPGEWSLEQHLNYGIRARRPEFRGGLTNNGTLNGTPELAVGLTPSWALGAYLPFAIRGDRFYPAGGKLRTMFTAPDAAARSFFYGLNVELSWQSRFFSTSRWNLEFRPILGYQTPRWEFIVNPIVDLGLGGRQGNSFLPASRVAWRARPDWQVGLESYSDLGPLGGFVHPRRQAHQLFAVTDFRLFGQDVHLGLGHGLTSASDRWVAKAIIGFQF